MWTRLIRFLFPYGAVRRVLRGPLRGMLFTVMPGMGATFALGVDAFNWRKIAGRLRPGMRVWDVGGNCGQMALFFSRAVGASGRVVSFEPAPRNADVLRENVRRNRLQNVEVLEVALAEVGGERAFVFDALEHQKGGLAGLAMKLPGCAASLSVRCASIDELVAGGRLPPEVLKIDVEGGGAEVIAGAVRTLADYRPAIYFELHADVEAGPELLALERLRHEWGYEVEVLAGDLAGVKDVFWGATVWCSPPRLLIG